MVKVVLHLNVPAPLRPKSSRASLGVVPVVRPGVRCPITRGPSWSGDGVAMAAGDEPAASGVPPPVSVSAGRRGHCIGQCRSAIRRGRSALWLCRLSANRCLCQLRRANLLGLLRGILGHENVTELHLIPTQLVLGGRVESRLEHRLSG
jgi:hypothetical protein